MGKIPKPLELEDLLRRVKSKEYIQRLHQRQALRRGISVEEYLKASKEEAIECASKALGITPEEATSQNWHEKPRFYIAAESIARKLSAERGTLVTAKDVLDEKQRRMTESEYPIVMRCLSQIDIFI